MQAIRFAVVDQLSDELTEHIRRELREYNREQNAAFYAAAAESQPRSLNVVAFDADARPVGGLFGETQLSWLKISIMSVRADSRRLGVGTRLMETAETEAISRGCRYVFTDTMSYQAPAFYQKLGYRVVGQVDDWDSHGNAKFYLAKLLVGRKPDRGRGST